VLDCIREFPALELLGLNKATIDDQKTKEEVRQGYRRLLPALSSLPSRKTAKVTITITPIFFSPEQFFLLPTWLEE
jgi:hypothetical protein